MLDYTVDEIAEMFANGLNPGNEDDCTRYSLEMLYLPHNDDKTDGINK